MPTLPERMAVVETKVTKVERVTDRIEHKVDELIAWRDEERGARKQRAASLRWIATGLTVLSAIVSAIVAAVTN